MIDPICTERLILRSAAAGDLDDLHAILSDPRAMRYWSTPPHRDLEQTRAWLAGMMATPPDLGIDFVVECDGVLIGKAGCYRFPDIGYILRPDYWGRGFAREALAAVIARIFGSSGLLAITADVDPRNLASLGLLSRLGFLETHRAKATWTIGDEVCDSVYLTLRRETFMPDSSPAIAT